MAVLGGAGRPVEADAVLGAVLAEGVGRAELVAVQAPVAGGADAGAVHRRALGVVLAVAALGAVLAVGVDRAGPGAGLARPAGLARALAGPRVAQLRVHGLALADLR